jgi:LPS sulfotransferase NodH
MLDKVQKLVKNPYLITGRLAKQLGAVFGTRNYKKFIVLTRSRTGSNMVINMLNSHPAVYADGEVFSSLNGKTVDDVLAGEFGKYLPYIKAVGFKIFYYHPQDDDSGLVWDRLDAMEDLRVIHLKRRNILRTLLSRKIAGATKVWGITKDAERGAIDERRVQFTEGELREGFEQTRDWEREFAQRFESKPSITLYYEDLLADRRKEFKRLTGLLGVKASEPKTLLVRQNPEKLHDLILNYDELKAAFAETEWTAFFED